MTGRKRAPIVLPLEEQLLKLDEAAEYFKVIPGTVKRWVDKGLLAGTRTPGGHRRVYLWSVLKMLEESDGKRPAA